MNKDDEKLNDYFDSNYNELSIYTFDELISSIIAMFNPAFQYLFDEIYDFAGEYRLENILKYIYDNYKENQVLIFTCSNREKEIMDKLDMEYNLVEL